jgi:hypothetical protein
VRRRVSWPWFPSILLAGALACQGGNAKDPISDFPRAGGGDEDPLSDWPGQLPGVAESEEDDSPPQEPSYNSPQPPAEMPQVGSANGSPSAAVGDSAADAGAIQATPSHPDAGEDTQEHAGANADAGVAAP